MSEASHSEEYDYRPLAKRYARRLPANSTMDWEDLYQEMMIASWQYGSIKSVHWAATCTIRNEHVRVRHREIEWAEPHRVRLDVICEAYHLIQRWSWLSGFLYGDSAREIARKAGLNESAIAGRINRIRATLGLAKRYRKKKRKQNDGRI